MGHGEKSSAPGRDQERVLQIVTESSQYAFQEEMGKGRSVKSCYWGRSWSLVNMPARISLNALSNLYSNGITCSLASISLLVLRDFLMHAAGIY